MPFYLVVFTASFFFVFSGARKLEAGPFDIILNGIDYCDDYATDEFKYTFKMKKLNRSTVAIDIDVNVTTPVDDNDILLLTLDKLSNNVWKKDFFKKEVDKVCSSGLLFSPELTRRLMKVGGIKNCPLPQRMFSARNFVLAIDLKVLPAFFYNKYRGSFQILAPDRHRKFCVYAFADLVPKGRKPIG